MILLPPEHAATLHDWFVPDRPGPLVGLHVLRTGNGACFVDRWPRPRVALVESAGNYALVGDPDALTPGDLRGRVVGFVEAHEALEPLLREASTTLAVWERVILELAERPPTSPPHEVEVRRLGPGDAFHVWGLSPDVAWIARTWGGPAGLAASGHARGAFVDGRLAAVACAFFVGERYEDVGVVTEREYRGAGLGPACAGALCANILDRGRRPSWSTSPDNTPSLRVAEKLGFAVQRDDRLYVIDEPIPAPARRGAE